MRAFDAKFGPDFLAAVPEAPGVYRIFDADGTLIYVGKAANLRRRLAQYRTIGRRKAHRKRRALVSAAVRIAWEVSESDLAASLAEIRLIQELRPPRNVVSAFPFLYPFIGVRDEGVETYFCLTTSPAAFPGFDLHGAFRSREVTRDAFAALARLLRWAGHPVPRHRCARFVAARHSRVIGFRRLPAGSPLAGLACCGASRGRRSRPWPSSCSSTRARSRAARRSRTTCARWDASSAGRPSRSPGRAPPRATSATRSPRRIATSCSRDTATLARERPEGGVRVALLHNPRPTAAPAGPADDEFEEYDSPGTIAAIAAALAPLGVSVEPVVADRALPGASRRDATTSPSTSPRARPALPRGVPAAVCELLGLPFTGSDPLTLAVTLDKAVARRIVSPDVPVAPAALVEDEADPAALAALRYPVIVKPNDEGSSKGIGDDAVAADAAGASRRCRDLRERYGCPCWSRSSCPAPRSPWPSRATERRPRPRRHGDRRGAGRRRPALRLLDRRQARLAAARALPRAAAAACRVSRVHRAPGR